MWPIYKYLDNSFVGQYFKAGCDIIAITMTTLKVHKGNPKFQFLQSTRKTKSATYPFSKFLNFSEGMAKSYPVELKLYRKSHLMNYKLLNNFLPKASIWIGTKVLHAKTQDGSRSKISR